MKDMLENNGNETRTLVPYLSPLAAWGLAFGCSVGWGAFVMPGNTFLPIAGPWGTAAGMAIGALILFIVGVNYSYLMNRHPEAGGAYAYARSVLGYDHGFLSAWMILITYIAIAWANATALSLISRFLFGDLFCFGFHYQIAGYSVYMGEILLASLVFIAAFIVCALGKKVLSIIHTASALMLFLGAAACFIAVFLHRGRSLDFGPAFSTTGSAPVQIFLIIIHAPWAFIGFESISHSTQEFKFDRKKSLPIMGAALVTGALTYIMLTFVASSAQPDGFSNWAEYISGLGTLEGINALPTFYNARNALGAPGLAILGAAALGGIITGVIANFVAISRLLWSMANDGMFPKPAAKLGKHGTPVNALLLITGVSLILPFFGRTAIGWIVDVTTIGAVIVYGYTCISAFVAGVRDKDKKAEVCGIVGAMVSVGFILYYLVPSYWSIGKLATESYLILAVWSLLGIIVFRMLLSRDTSRRMGKNETVWVTLLFLILIISFVWMRQSASDESVLLAEKIMNLSDPEKNEVIMEHISDFDSRVNLRILINVLLISAALIVVFSIFSIIKKREAQIEAEKQEAEQLSRAKSIFLSNMSHDIRTPMNAIIGYTSLALKEKDIPQGVHTYLNKIDYSSKHLLSLINDVLDMSRIENGKMELFPIPMDINEAFDQLGDIFSVQMREKGLDYRIDHSGVKHSAVLCDKNRLMRILLNLVSNSFKFTPAGGSVTVSVTQTGTEGENGIFRIRVRDTGMGMSKEFAEHIFEAFERERSSMIDNIQGTGLGMSITKSFVDMMNGTISVSTEKGRGTEFVIDLPLKLVDPSEIETDEEKKAVDEKVDFSGMTVLLTDDNPINLEIAEMLLTDLGFSVETAENGRAALEKVRKAPEDKFSLVLMDVQMPVMNGYEATRGIRALEGKRAEIPVIAMSANAFEEDVQNALEAGMNAHIAKPIDVKLMTETIERILSERK